MYINNVPGPEDTKHMNKFPLIEPCKGPITRPQVKVCFFNNPKPLRPDAQDHTCECAQSGCGLREVMQPNKVE